MARGGWRFIGVALVCAAASGGPSTKRVDRWKAPRNRERLQLTWHDVTKVADAEPARPILLFVSGLETKTSRSIEKDVFTNAAVVLATRACPAARVTPDKAVELPFLRALPRIQDPMLVVVGADRGIVGALTRKSRFKARYCLELMEQAADAAYETPLRDYLKSFLDHLDATEDLWRDETKYAEEKKNGAAAAGDLTARRQELDARGVAVDMHASTLAAGLPLKAGEPQTDDDRDLTAAEKGALDGYRRLRAERAGVGRALALDALRGFDSAAMVRAILREVRRGDSWTVWRAAGLLRAMESGGAVRALGAALRQGGRRERTAALLGFTARADADAADAMPKLARAPDPAVRSAAVRAMAAQEDPETLLALVARLGDDDAGVRTLAASALARRGDARHVDALRPLLADGDWGVRRAAVDTLGRLPAREAVPLLLDVFEREPDRLTETCHDALVRLTGRRFRLDAAAWRAWWTESKDTFELASLQQAADSLEAAWAHLRSGAFTWPRAYASIGTLSRRVCFVLDIGPTMTGKVEVPPNTPEDRRKELWKGSKLDLAKAAIVASLERADADVRFNVLAFAGGVEPWRSKLAQAAHRKSAIRFVRDLKAIRPAGAGGGRRSGGADEGPATVPVRTVRGLTASPAQRHERNVFAALLSALGVFDAEPFEDRTRPEADTIVLIVDASPSVGQLQRMDRLVAAITELNRSRGVVIHVVAFAERERHDYEPLAVSTGGLHVVYGR